MRNTLPCGDGAVLIVGAGLAGLYLALKLAPRNAVVLSPAPLGQGAASAWAQGGLAAALDVKDTPAAHAADTIAAGAGLVDPAVAMLLAQEGPSCVHDLAALGVPFDRDASGALLLNREAAHGHARVARVTGDQAGQAIMAALIASVRRAAHVRVIEGLAARALLQDDHGRVRGVIARDAEGALFDVTADHTVIAAGGIGGLYRVTTNPPTALGHGLAMAARAGALIGDPEFVQFHPTAIDVGRDPAPLATESLRGEGAKLIDRDGQSFVDELAPRDIVARAIHVQVQSQRGAFLDARSVVRDFPHEFPTVFAACMAAGIDPREQPIPVAPAAHYHMGGIVSDLVGKTTLEGLSVIGESASTGAHGANRLASNSLLEAVVFAARAAADLRNAASPAPAQRLNGEAPPDMPAEQFGNLRAIMDAELGVERGEPRLSSITNQVATWARAFGPANELIVAGLIAEGARRRTSSVGAHFRYDYPDTHAGARTFLTRADLGWLS